MTEGARWRRPGLAAVALVAAAAAAGITWSTRSTQSGGADVRVMDAWDDAQDARRTGVPPRVLVDRSDVTIASSEVRHLGQLSPDVYLQVLRADGTNRMVFLSSADGTGLLYEDILDPTLEAVQVGSRTGYLRRNEGRTRSLGLPGVSPGDGEGFPALRLVPSGIDDDDLVALAASLHPRPAGQPGVVLPERLPLGLQAVGEGRPSTPAGPWVHTMLRLPGVEFDADFRAEPSTGLDFQSRLGELVADRPSPESLTLGGRQAWLLGSPGSFSAVLWDVADGWRVMLHAGVSADRMRELAASLRVVDQATWDAHQPPGYFTLGEREAEVARLLAAIPPPPGVAWDALDVANMNPDPVRFRSEVASLAACAWAEEYNSARYATGADPGPALQVLADARDWPAVKEGGYLDPEALAGFAAGGEEASAATSKLSCRP